MRELNIEELSFVSGGDGNGGRDVVTVTGTRSNNGGYNSELDAPTGGDDEPYEGGQGTQYADISIFLEKLSKRLTPAAADKREANWKTYNVVGMKLGVWHTNDLTLFGKGAIGAYMTSASENGETKLFLDFNGNGTVDTVLYIRDGELWNDSDLDGTPDTKLDTSDPYGNYEPYIGGYDGSHPGMPG